MNDEAGFLSKLLEDPADDTTRLVYADWLTERGDAEGATKAKFLRLTVQLREPKRRSKQRKQLQPLAAELPTEWLAVVSRLTVDRCGAKLAPEWRLQFLRGQFDFVCEREWDEMTPTADPRVRFCERCVERVYYCDTIGTAREHAEQGHCVAVDLGIIRRDGDLAGRPPMVRGRISVDRVRELERKHSLPDPVSQAREEQKRQQKAPDPTN